MLVLEIALGVVLGLFVWRALTASNHSLPHKDAAGPEPDNPLLDLLWNEPRKLGDFIEANGRVEAIAAATRQLCDEARAQKIKLPFDLKVYDTHGLVARARCRRWSGIKVTECGPLHDRHTAEFTVELSGTNGSLVKQFTIPVEGAG